MDLSAIFLLLAILLLIILFVGQPLTVRKRHLAESEHELSAVMAERDRLLNTLQELDFDNSLGKIPPEEYPLQRAVLLQHGADILRKLDALIPASSPQGMDESVEERLEARIAARRDAKIRESAVSGIPDEELEERIARRRAARKEKIAGFCPHCGKPVVQTDVFCPSCGNRLK